MGFECVEVCLDLLVRYQSIDSELQWASLLLEQKLSLKKEEKDDEFYECHECENDFLEMEASLWLNGKSQNVAKGWLST